LEASGKPAEGLQEIRRGYELDPGDDFGAKHIPRTRQTELDEFRACRGWRIVNSRMISHDSSGFLVLLRILRCAILLFFSVAAGAADAARFEHDGNPIEASPTASAATASGHLSNGLVEARARASRRSVLPPQMRASD
jgi:hypothetical protein